MVNRKLELRLSFLRYRKGIYLGQAGFTLFQYNFSCFLQEETQREALRDEEERAKRSEMARKTRQAVSVILELRMATDDDG